MFFSIWIFIVAIFVVITFSVMITIIIIVLIAIVVITTIFKVLFCSNDKALMFASAYHCISIYRYQIGTLNETFCSVYSMREDVARYSPLLPPLLEDLRERSFRVSSCSPGNIFVFEGLIARRFAGSAPKFRAFAAMIPWFQRQRTSGPVRTQVF